MWVVMVGDLIEIKPKDSDPQDRTVGTVLRRSSWNGECGTVRGPGEPIIEVLWNTGHASWILEERIQKIANY